MKKLLIFTLLGLFIYLTHAFTISKNGAIKRCFKKRKNSSSPNNNNNDNNNNIKEVKVSCQSLVTDVTTDDNNSMDQEQFSINFADNIIIPKGTVLSDNEACVNSLYSINKLVKQVTKNNIFKQSCDEDFDLNAFSEGLKNIKNELTGFIEESITKCSNSKIWNGAKLHQACRILNKTDQTVCHSIIDEAYERYDSKCLMNSSLADMWEFTNWLWNQLVANDGCYLKQLYNYKCHPKKDALVHLGQNTYSLRLLCESDANSCDWPGTYTGNNIHVKCLSENIINNKVAAINILKKNGYVCEGTDDLPKTLNIPDGIIDSDSDDDNDGNQDIGNSNNNVNSPGSNSKNKAYIVSSGSEPWTNMNQIIGTIFIGLFALLF